MPKWKQWAGHPGLQYDTSKVDWPVMIAAMIASGMIRQDAIKDNDNPPPIEKNPCPCEEILAYFNLYLDCSNRLTVSRRHSLKLRWQVPFWRDNWRTAILRASQSNFLRGQNDRGWRIDMEFFCRPDSVDKIIEGKYDNRQAVTKHETSQLSSITSLAEAVGLSECPGTFVFNEEASGIHAVGSALLDCSPELLPS
jgi:hypothetical protein